MRIRSFLFYVSFVGALVLFSCNSDKKFQIKGNFSSATDEVIYLEHRSLGGIELLDSAKLSAKGDFKFKALVPENPEFYQFRVDGKTVVFAAINDDDVQVSGDLADLYNTFRVENSVENSQLKFIDDKTRAIKRQFDILEKEHTSKRLDDVEYLTAVDSALTEYKTEIAKVIIGNPSGPAAYYAVFQKINDYLIFDPYDKKDYAMYGAVATSWNQNYEGTPRTTHLYKFVMNVLRERKQMEKQTDLIENAPIIEEAVLPDITLKGIDGKSVSLSSLKGKTVILDFTVYNSEFSPKHNIGLNDIYTQLKSSGVEIYQISFDSDEHFWKNAAINLPWITVRDTESVYSSLLTIYNVREIPTTFIVNKEGDLVSRIENYSNLAAEVRKAL